MHVRGGDYFLPQNAKIFQTCSIDYYSRSIDYIKKTVSDPQFYIFSNDLEWAKKCLKIDIPIGNIHFVDNSMYEHSAELDMFLMSQCKHNIIANSTFSWWGAWLNDNKDKIVIAPKKWYKEHVKYNIDNLIPSNWHKI